MAIVLKPKKSETASAVPTTGDLAVGEICMNIADKKIYTRKSDNSIVIVSSHTGDAAVGGDLTGTISNAQIGSNTVTATELADNSVGIAELNVADGTNLQVLTTNGSGTLSWTSKTDATLGANSVGITELDVSDGSAGQYLTTNGNGTLSFATDSTNVGATSVGGDVTGTVSNIQIAANAVDGTHIALGSDAAGDVMYYNGTNYIRLAKGSNGEVLTLASGVPSWAADSTNVGATSVGGDVTGTVANIQIAANAVDGTHIALGSDAAGDVMYYNGTNYIRLAKGTATQVLTMNSGATAPEWAADSTNVTGTSVGGDLSGTVGNAQIATNTVGITELNVSDGTNGQVLKTNGSGTLSFTDSGATLQQATSKAVTMAIALG